jgi:hypothetical protein
MFKTFKLELLSVLNYEKKFKTLYCGAQLSLLKNFFSLSLMKRLNKLDHFVHFVGYYEKSYDTLHWSQLYMLRTFKLERLSICK